MNSDIDLKKILAKLLPALSFIKKRFAFGAVIIALLVYILTVWQVKNLATAEPKQEDVDSQTATTAQVQIDKKAIENIQSLEQASPEIHSLFDSARTNPFGQ